MILRGSNVYELFAAGRIPLSTDEIGRAETEIIEAKSFIDIRGGDVVIGSMSGGAGYGDPLRRDPELVARDVRGGLVSTEYARSVYGVIVSDGQLDASRTEVERDRMRAERLAGSRPVDGGKGEGTLEDGVVLHPVSDTVEAVEAGGRRSLRCTVCHYRFGDYQADHKRAAVMRELPLTAVSPHNILCMPEFKVREFYCPGCGTQVAGDVQRSDEPILDESTFRSPGTEGEQPV
jgi:N-methylhydantoinase B